MGQTVADISHLPNSSRHQILKHTVPRYTEGVMRGLTPTVMRRKGDRHVARMVPGLTDTSEASQPGQSRPIIIGLVSVFCPDRAVVDLLASQSPKACFPAQWRVVIMAECLALYCRTDPACWGGTAMANVMGRKFHFAPSGLLAMAEPRSPGPMTLGSDRRWTSG